MRTLFRCRRGVHPDLIGSGRRAGKATGPQSLRHRESASCGPPRPRGGHSRSTTSVPCATRGSRRSASTSPWNWSQCREKSSGWWRNARGTSFCSTTGPTPPPNTWCWTLVTRSMASSRIRSLQPTDYLYVAHVPDKRQETPTGSRISRASRPKAIRRWPTGPARRSSSSGPPAGTTAAACSSGRTATSTSSTGDGSGIADELANRPGPQRPARRRSCGSTSIIRAKATAYGDPAGQSVRRARQRRAAGDLGLRPAASLEVQLRPRRPATCGPARSARTCGRWSTASSRAATTAGASRKGTHPFRPGAQAGADADHRRRSSSTPHSDFRSITGGYVYHGKRLPELEGAYIYGDYDTGRVWALALRRRPEGRREHSELADTQLRIVDFGEDDARRDLSRSTSSAGSCIGWCRRRQPATTRRLSRAS